MLGGISIAGQPDVVLALNPWWAVQFFLEEKWLAFVSMGSVVLAVTGAEALYADMGHFGRRPIRAGWVYFVLPALMINYLGQGALLMARPEAISNPFFLLAPQWFLLPLVLIATAATIIASQAVISGAFSVTQQAIHLGYIPRIKITHTSAAAASQIYIPTVNWALMVMVILLVLVFQTSSNLTAAYGIAVTGAMFIDTCLLAVVLFSLWGWNKWLAAAVLALFFVVDAAYFAANLLKVPSGGWFPLLIGFIIFTLLTTWAKGRKLLRNQLKQGDIPIQLFIKSAAGSAARVPGTAIFMTSQADGVPHALLHNLKHNKVLHERSISLRVKIEDVPYVDEEKRVEVEALGEGFYRDHPPFRLHAGHERARGAGRDRGLRAAVQDDGDELLPLPPDPARGEPRNGDLAREAVRLDDAQRREPDGILRPSAEPRRRDGQPGEDLRSGDRFPRCSLFPETPRRPCVGASRGAGS